MIDRRRECVCGYIDRVLVRITVEVVKIFPVRKRTKAVASRVAST